MPLDLDALRRTRYESASFHIRDRDVALYNLSVGARCLRHTYEGDPAFAALPTFAVVPAMEAKNAVNLSSFLPRFNHDLLLHGEHYLRLEGPLPREESLISMARIVDVGDKGKAAVVVVGIDSCDVGGRLVCYNEITYFIRGSGGFGNNDRHSPAQRDAAASAANDAPPRPPDAVLTEATEPWQAALYRLNGDRNPLHIDPRVAAAAGFPRPILHGLCTLGVSVRSILTAFSADSGDEAVLSVKARFSGHVFPGETLQISTWQTDAHTVLFMTHVSERKALAISQAAVTFRAALPARPQRMQQAKL